MPINRRDLRDRFIPEHYENAAARDIWSFTNAVSFKGYARAADNYDRWTSRAQVSGQKASPGVVILPGSTTKKTFDNIYKNINSQPLKAAECSNFAGHAMSVLLNDPDVIKDYNVCLASLDRIHNIAILLPKEASPLSKDDKKKGKLPVGSLIVDPWAMAMGYDADEALAVRPSRYAFKGHVSNIEIHYESIHDKTIYPEASALDTPRPTTVTPLQASTRPPVSASPAPTTPRAPVSVSPAATTPRAPVSVSPAATTPRAPVSVSPEPSSPRTPVSMSPEPTTSLRTSDSASFKPARSPMDGFIGAREKIGKLLNPSNPGPVTAVTRQTTRAIKDQLQGIKTEGTDAKSTKPVIPIKPVIATKPLPETAVTRQITGAQTQSIKDQLQGIKTEGTDAKSTKPKIAPKPSTLPPRL
jgi:hypothetical protein